jgi:hypothetical protein
MLSYPCRNSAPGCAKRTLLIAWRPPSFDRSSYCMTSNPVTNQDEKHLPVAAARPGKLRLQWILSDRGVAFLRLSAFGAVKR